MIIINNGYSRKEDSGLHSVQFSGGNYRQKLGPRWQQD